MKEVGRKEESIRSIEDQDCGLTLDSFALVKQGRKKDRTGKKKLGGKS